MGNGAATTQMPKRYRDAHTHNESEMGRVATALTSTMREGATGNIGSRYRIDFALIMLAGNRTRYLITRPIVERDPAILARWYPIRTWVHGDWLRFLPAALRVRVRHLLDSWLLYLRSPGDAVVIHAFETYYLYALVHWLLRLHTVIINNPDGPLPPSGRGIRGAVRRLAVHRTDLFVPWSGWAASLIKESCPELRDNQVLILHPGIDLTRWPRRESVRPGTRFRLLFVARDAILKGADTLLDAFEQYLSDSCELHIATQSDYLPSSFKHRISNLSHVKLHLDLSPISEELKQLYRACDVFVLPTNGDTSSWVALEALATGIPVVICPQGGIPDIVRDGETGLLIPPKDAHALAEAVDRLRTNPELRSRLAKLGREHVEANFDAEKNTERLLSAIKALIDGRNLST